MKKKKIFFRIITAVFACVFLISMLSFTAYATGEGGEDEQSVSGEDTGDTGGDTGDDTGSGDTGSGGDSGSGESGDSGSGDPSSGDPGSGDMTPTEADEGDYDHEEPTEEPIDAQSTYTEPEHLDDLPEVSEGEVELATAVDIPAAPVSDTSLLSGIIMWLCVAVGIAVVVGVLVSRRTRRRGQ